MLPTDLKIKICGTIFLPLVLHSVKLNLSYTGEKLDCEPLREFSDLRDINMQGSGGNYVIKDSYSQEV
jgi:hypothetical protein